MKLYRMKVPEIAHQVIEKLVNAEMIDVTPEGRAEAELDLVAIMEEYLNRDHDLREAVREHMASLNMPYDQYGKVRGQFATDWGHPVGNDVERYLTRQFIENFMISRWVEEVFAEDKEIHRAVIDVLSANNVDERVLRDEARERVKNLTEGTVEFELAISEAMRDVKKRHGLIR